MKTTLTVVCPVYNEEEVVRIFYEELHDVLAGKVGWSVRVFKYQRSAIKNNNMLVNRHYEYMKKWGMKGNKCTFKLIHFLNRLRILYKYYRFSTRH